MSAQQGVLKLLEAVEALREEVIRRLDELEEKLGERISKEELARFMELQYHLTTAVALGYYLQILAKSPNPTIYEFEESLRKLLRIWKKVIDENRKLFGVVDWSIIQDGSSLILTATRSIGLPFGTVAGLVVEVMEADAEKFLSEASIAEIYGTINLTQWRRLINK
ncbi:MAG TPA: hypothetical protein ENF33_04980 [Nitrososphaeria archaeon]|nr:MAG: hypothetical protein DRN68_01885 [Nitrososphaerota archaeon]HDJ67043.1 hypothetical protein [Nitrososphaeria archaeon]